MPKQVIYYTHMKTLPYGIQHAVHSAPFGSQQYCQTVQTVVQLVYGDKTQMQDYLK